MFSVVPGIVQSENLYALSLLMQEETLLLTNQFCASMVLRDDRASAMLGEEALPLTFMVTWYLPL